MKLSYTQPPLFPLDSLTPEDSTGLPQSQANSLRPEDRAFHDWYRFVLSFPPHLVRNYLEDFGLGAESTVLDPFCGTGTTLVEAKLRRIPSVGLEANPFPHFASSVKVDWRIRPETLLDGALEVAHEALAVLKSQGIGDDVEFNGQAVELRTLDARSAKILIKDSISPLPLHKTLVLLDCLKLRAAQPHYQYGLLALGNALVYAIGNLRFGPEVGVGQIKSDVPVVAA
jgi:hypothetical protein